MPSVTFSFRPEVPADKRQKVLDAIGQWSSVLSASLLKPDAKSEVTKLMAYARVEESADVDAIVKRISALPEVEAASLPARRRLL